MVLRPCLRMMIAATVDGLREGAASLRLDACVLHDRPPFGDLGLLQGRERRGRLLLARHDLASGLRRRWRTAPSAKASIMAALSRAITSRGVPLGAHSANHGE